MGVKEDLALEGFGELDAMLEALPNNVARGAVARVMRRAGKLMAERQRELAPRDDGVLAASIGVAVKSRNLTGLAEYAAVKQAGGTSKDAAVAMRKARDTFGSEGTRIVMTIGATAPHAHLVEFGSSERFHKKSGKSTGTMPDQPFIRPAFDATKNQVVAMIRKEITDEVIRTTNRYKKRTGR